MKENTMKSDAMDYKYFSHFTIVGSRGYSRPYSYLSSSQQN